MAKYNTFLVIASRRLRILLVTSSAHKAMKLLTKGNRIDVWNENELVDKIYYLHPEDAEPYLEAEREYRRYKQEKAEARNAFREVMRA